MLYRGPLQEEARISVEVKEGRLGPKVSLPAPTQHLGQNSAIGQLCQRLDIRVERERVYLQSIVRKALGFQKTVRLGAIPISGELPLRFDLEAW
jgi:hypothetical protein